MDLFENSAQKTASSPLAERMRPENLDDMVGQQHLIGEGRILRRLIETDQLSSVIFWGQYSDGNRPR